MKWPIEVVFKDPGPLGITWQMKGEDNILDMSIEKIKPGSVAGGKRVLSPGLTLTKVAFADGSFHELTHTIDKDDMIGMIVNNPRPLTLTLQVPVFPTPEGEEKPEGPEEAEEAAEEATPTKEEAPGIDTPETAEWKGEFDNGIERTKAGLDALHATVLSGTWEASGRDEDGPGVEELILLRVSENGSVTGAVDDGDGIFEADGATDDGDCVINNGNFDPGTGTLKFN